MAVRSVGTGQVPQTDEPEVPSTLDQLFSIAERPVHEVESVWGNPGASTAVPASIAAQSENATTAMEVVKNVTVQPRHQIESLVPTEHYEIQTTVPFVKPAEIAAALIAAGMLTSREWAASAAHYTYESNFTHYISIPDGRKVDFDLAEESAREIVGSRTTRTGPTDFTLTISKPGRTSTNATIKNVPVEMTRDALVSALESVENIKVVSIRKNPKNQAVWNAKMQGSAVKGLHHLRLRNLVRQDPRRTVDLLILIPGRKIACKVCASTEHPHWKCDRKPTNNPSERQRKELAAIEREIARVESVNAQRRVEDEVPEFFGGERNPELQAALDEEEKEGESEWTEVMGRRKRRIQARSHKATNHEETETETNSDKPSKRRHKGEKSKKPKRSKQEKKNRKREENSSDDESNTEDSKETKPRQENSEKEKEGNEESYHNDNEKSEKENKEDRERGEVDSKQEEKDPLVTRTQALKAIQELAAGVPLERLSGSTQTLLVQEGASGGYQMDDYSRQGLGDSPTDLVIDLEREGNSIRGDGAGTSLPYHSVTDSEHPQPTPSPIGSSVSTTTSFLVTSTPISENTWAARSPDVSLEPDEANSILSSMDPPRPEGNFGFKSKFVNTRDVLHMSPISERITTPAQSTAEMITIEGSQPHRPERQQRLPRQAKSKLKPSALRSPKPPRT